MEYSKYLRERAAEMSEFALTATEPAASEFFKLASLCRDSADRIERLSLRGAWINSWEGDAPKSLEPSTSPAVSHVELAEGQRREDLAPGHRVVRCAAIERVVASARGASGSLSAGGIESTSENPLVASIGLDPRFFGTHSPRRTKATLIYRPTLNLRAVQLLLGHRRRSRHSGTGRRLNRRGRADTPSVIRFSARRCSGARSSAAPGRRLVIFFRQQDLDAKPACA
jgi:hypothetical protein